MTLPLLLIPGTLCDARVFGPMIARLEREVICTPPIAHADVGAAAADVLAHAPERFVAGGFSLGGFVVLELLRRAPERLAGAVLIASNALPFAPERADERRREVATARAAGMDVLIAELWPRYVSLSRRDDLALRRLLVDMAEAVGSDRFGLQAELAITRPDSRDTVRDTAVSLLMLAGEEDAMSPSDDTPGSTTITRQTVPGVGHFASLEAPNATAAAIGAWVKGLT